MNPKGNDNPNNRTPVECDGQTLKQLTRAGLIWLERHYEMVNSLNVFPVPDGDTGTNMLLTMRSAYNEIAGSEETHVGRVAQQIYNGALMGARGNSGVILSQLWRGFARGLSDRALLDTPSVIRGFEEAVSTAYKAVQEPVEGTMLTVAREAYEEASAFGQEEDDLPRLLERVVQRCHLSVQKTPELLDVLRKAGVVDSGGMGLALILEGMLHHLEGEDLEGAFEVSSEASGLDVALAPEDELGYGYDVQFLLKGSQLDVTQVRADIEAMGNSGLIVGDEQLIKVHIHVHDPGVPLSYGVAHGIIRDIVVENMQEQFQEFAVHEAPAYGDASQVMEHGQVMDGTIAVVTVSPGEGLSQIFYSLGAGKVIPGGQTMNPSTKQIIEAIDELPTDKVIVLPNNKNIIMAAEQAVEQVNGKQVRVIPTRSVPQGIAALLAHDPYQELDAAQDAMLDASRVVETGEVTLSTRDATISGIQVKKGQVIGLHNDTLCVAGEELEAVVVELLEKMGSAELELITVYYGQDIDQAQSNALLRQIQHAFPEQEVELREGGQPHYYYILSGE
jgi:DAK2 domain fusion protein YloV